MEFVGVLRAAHGVNPFDQMYPFRIGVRVIRLLDPPVPFVLFVPRLEFILSKLNWGAHLRGRSLIRLSNKDYETLYDGLVDDR